jgi:hypothetical protein
MFTETDFKKFWKLNPKFTQENNNYKNTYYYLDVLLSNNPKLSTGEPLTFDIIVNRYKKYLIDWQRTIGARGEQFVGKDDKLITIYNYLVTKMYESEEREIIPEADPRYEIIFGGVPLSEVMKSFNEFKNVIK